MIEKLLKSAAFLLVVAFAASGCDPSRFLISGNNPIQCRIFSPVATVEHRGRVFVMEDGAIVDMSVSGLTQFHFSMNVKLYSGDGVALMMRPVAQESVTDPGITLILSRSHSHIDSGNVRIQDLPGVTFDKDSLAFITVRSENEHLVVTVGCDTVLQRMTPLAETDDLVVKSLEASRVMVIAPEWKELSATNGDESSTDK